MRKFLTLLVSIIPLLVVGAPIIHAQEATVVPDVGWPVEERCVGAPTKPPKGWSYDGTILMTGYAGIHGVNAKWDTPRVLAKLSEKDLWGGAVSPDGKWYASPYGDRTTLESYNTITETHEAHIYGLASTRSPIVIKPLEGFTGQQTHGYVYWVDNQEFMFGTNDGTQLINISSSTISPWKQLDHVFDGNDNFRFSFSPDWSRVIYQDSEENKGYFAVIHDIAENVDINDLAIRQPIIWRPDSSQFIGDLSENLYFGNGELDEKLGLFDRNGHLINLIFEAPSGQQFGRLNAAWSSDGRYAAFIAFDYYVDDDKRWIVSEYDRNNTLYIIDMQNQRIIDTCMSIGVGAAWQPRHHQLAFLTPGDGLRDVLVFDMDSYELHAVAKHMVSHDRRNHFIFYTTDTVLGWRAD